MQLKRIITVPVGWLVYRAGYRIVRRPRRGELPPMPHDVTDEEREDITRAIYHTMTTVERVITLQRAIEYLHANQIQGDIVECGVWKGGSMMAAALKLMRLGDQSRTLWLYDTFEGMSEPTEVDETWNGHRARPVLEEKGAWFTVPLEHVQSVMAETAYDPNHIRFVKGRVEDTIPDQVPERIALLRLDTDFYESTRHELEHLYPRLASGGVLIIDDYECWRGARKATDEFFAEHETKPFLNRIDDDARLIIKM